MSDWYSRHVFFVSDINLARKFYLEDLEFDEAWVHKESENVLVAQVNKYDFELILAIDLDRAGKSRVFIELEENELQALRNQIKSKSLVVQDGWWGSPVIQMHDPDGNELFFPLDD